MVDLHIYLTGLSVNLIFERFCVSLACKLHCCSLIIQVQLLIVVLKMTCKFGYEICILCYIASKFVLCCKTAVCQRMDEN